MSFKDLLKRGSIIAGLTGVMVFSMGATTTREVTVNTDFGNQLYMTTATTVGEFLEEEDIAVFEGQAVFPGKNTSLEDGAQISIKDGQEIYLLEDGVTKEIPVESTLVSDIVEELGIVLDENDYTVPNKTRELKENDVLAIYRVEDNEEIKELEIPYETITRENPNMYKGETKVVQEGITGLIAERFNYTLVNGEKRNQVVVASEVVREAQDEIIEIGTKEGNFIEGKRYIKKITMEATAYDPSAGSYTAMGTRARVGAVAVDPRVIPLGTKLYIESADGFPTYGFATAEDTGGAIKGNKIDLFYNSNYQARQFGRRNVVVYVLADE